MKRRGSYVFFKVEGVCVVSWELRVIDESTCSTASGVGRYDVRVIRSR